MTDVSLISHKNVRTLFFPPHLVKQRFLQKCTSLTSSIIHPAIHPAIHFSSLSWGKVLNQPPGIVFVPQVVGVDPPCFCLVTPYCCWRRRRRSADIPPSPPWWQPPLGRYRRMPGSAGQPASSASWTAPLFQHSATKREQAEEQDFFMFCSNINAKSCPSYSFLGHQEVVEIYWAMMHLSGQSHFWAQASLHGANGMSCRLSGLNKTGNDMEGAVHFAARDPWIWMWPRPQRSTRLKTKEPKCLLCGWLQKLLSGINEVLWLINAARLQPCRQGSKVTKICWLS